MLKMRKFLLLLLFPLALLSCGSNRNYGHYAFQMGSDKGSHFGVFVDLTQEDYYMAEEEGGEEKLMGKKFKFGMRVSEDMVPMNPFEDPDFDPEDDPDPIGTIEKLFVYMLINLLNVEVENPDDPDDPKGVTGYYKVGEKEIEERGKKLDMTIVLADSLGVPSDLIQKLIVAYVKGKNIQIMLPVSVRDFQYQLCWYGMYINIDFLHPEEINIVDFYDGEHDHLLPMPGPEGEERIGSHPTIEDIIEMNERYGPEAEDEKCRIFKKDWFRDFNTLTIDLLKS